MDKTKPNDRTTLLLDYGWMPIGILTARAQLGGQIVYLFPQNKCIYIKD